MINIEQLIKYQNVLSAMSMGDMSREEGRKLIDIYNKVRDEDMYGLPLMGSEDDNE